VGKKKKSKISVQNLLTYPDEELSEDARLIKEYFVRIIRCMPNNVYWLDRNCITLGCNDNVLRLVGLEKLEDFIGITYEKMGKIAHWTEGQANSFKKDDTHVMETGEALCNVEEPPIYAADGKPIYYMSSRFPLKDDDQNVIGVVGISVDITSQKNAEQLRLENALHKNRMETMRLLAASIAHELRTPLGSIRVETENLLESLPTLLEAYELAKTCNLPVKPLPMRRLKGMQEAILVIKDETVYANTIINMLLTNIQEPTVRQKEVETLSMQHCIQTAIKRYPFVSEEQASLVHLDPSVDFEVNGVELLLEHLLFNLFRNSLYFIEAVGKGEIYIWLKKGEAENIMYFKDTGKGIAPEIIERIFDRFVGTRHHGTGVGLAFCKEVMVEHRGTIACESVVGEYALFTLTFPAV
jgi:signal transduction histidine kinase